MWKLRIGAFLTSGLLVLGTSAAARAATGGDPNAGDVWVDSATSPSGGPGHEMDPHLPCQEINLWGSGLADSSGPFTIDGWAPSGSQEVDYSGTWNYDHSSAGDQIIATINVSTLTDQAQANGDTPSAQGFHFKLDFSQDPQKHKTFWVACTPSSSSDGGGGGGGGGGGRGGGGGGNDGGGTSSDAPSDPTTTTPVVTSIAATSSTHKAHTAHKKRKRHHRRHRRHAHHVKTVTIHLPSFTG